MSIVWIILIVLRQYTNILFIALWVILVSCSYSAGDLSVEVNSKVTAAALCLTPAQLVPLSSPGVALEPSIADQGGWTHGSGKRHQPRSLILWPPTPTSL